jgi:Flp pilus assembly protein TadG
MLTTRGPAAGRHEARPVTARSRRRWCDRWGAEDGNTLALFPAAVLVMFLLASLAIDAAITFNAQRTLADIAASVANDAASAMSPDDYYTDQQLRIDPAAAAARSDATLARRTDAAAIDAACAVDAVGTTVVVTCTGQVRQLISPMRYLGVATRDIQARATAIAVQG